MTIDENKALIHRFYKEVWNHGNLAVADEIFADDYVRHDLRPFLASPIHSAPPGPEGQKQIAAMFRAAFPDMKSTVDLMIAEGNTVVARRTTQGTHTGPWADVAPTGKAVTFSGVNIFRISGGKVVEIWNHRDDLGLMQQLGAPVYAGYSGQR